VVAVEALVVIQALFNLLEVEALVDIFLLAQLLQ
jgi:hypothetical protein